MGRNFNYIVFIRYCPYNTFCSKDDFLGKFTPRYIGYRNFGQQFDKNGLFDPGEDFLGNFTPLTFTNILPAIMLPSLTKMLEQILRYKLP